MIDRGHHDHQTTRTLRDVAALFIEGSGNEIERDRRLFDFPVVNTAQFAGIGHGGPAQLYGRLRLHLNLKMLPFHVVQEWPLAAKAVAGVGIFLVGFLAFLAVTPGGGDRPTVLTENALLDEEATVATDGEQGANATLPPGAALADDAAAEDEEIEQGASSAEAPTVGEDSGAVFEPLRNAQPKFSRFADVASESLDVGALTEAAERPDNGTVGDGQFRAACEYSHFSYDDPIVFPGEPGRAHLHMFFGNTETDAFTTTETLINSGGGTCNGFELNRSAYWTPALIDGDNNAVVPDAIILYYKSSSPGSVQAMPQGLKMVAGNATAETFTASPQLAWSCGENGFGYNYTNRIPECGGDVINASIVFPNCWDGVNLDSDDHLSHLTYIDETQECPAQYPVRLPQISILLYFPGTDSIDGWHLSSDRAGGFNTGPGATLHADWWGGWNDEAMDLWTSGCMQAARNCSYGQTGSSIQLASLNPLQRYEGPNLLALPDGSYPRP